MKEEIEDVFDEIKKRLSNPLVGSFILAWLAINWYIPVILLFYKQNELKLDGYKSYKAAILSQIKIDYNLWYPLGVAFGYIIIMPHIKGLINWYQAKFNVFFENRVNEENDKVKTFAQKLELLKTKLAEVELGYENQNKTSEEMETELTENKQLVSSLNFRLDNMVAIRTEILGIWKVSVESGEDGIWVIDDFGIKKRHSSTEEMIYKIISNVGVGRDIIFELADMDKRPSVLTLRKSDIPERMTGFLNRSPILITKPVEQDLVDVD